MRSWQQACLSRNILESIAIKKHKVFSEGQNAWEYHCSRADVYEGAGRFVALKASKAQLSGLQYRFRAVVLNDDATPLERKI